jgi:MFS family permease
MRNLLRNRALLRIGLAEAVSGVGNWVTTLAVYALVIFRGEGNVASSGSILLAGLLPALLASPLAGWLCDRFDRKRLMIASELLSGLAVLGLIFTRRPLLVYGLLAAQSAVGTLLMPARQAAIPQIVDREELTRANALLQQLAGILKIGGPFIAGLLLAVVEPQQAMVLDVISFALSALVLGRLPALPPTREPAARGGAAPDRASGLLDALRRAPLLAFLLAISFLTVVLIMSYDVLSPVYTRDILRGGESLFGSLISLIGLGMVAATVVLIARPGRGDPLRDLVAGLFLVGCIPASLALGAETSAGAARWLAAGGCLLGGFGNGMLLVQMHTLLQLLSPPALLGRIGGASQSTLVGGQLVSALLTPLLVPGTLSIGGFFALAAIGMAVLGLVTGTVWWRRAGTRTQKCEEA